METGKPLLNEIQHGLYSLDGSPNFTDENLVVAVHPFFRSYEGVRDDKYISRLNDFIRSRKNPILTLEEKHRTTSTARHYLSLGSKENRFFIKTRKNDSIPSEITLEELVEHIERLRNGKPVDLIGGYFFRNPDYLPDFGGCCGYIAEILSRENILFKALNIKFTLSATNLQMSISLKIGEKI